MNLSVWMVYATHQHVKHDFPLGPRLERFGDLLRFSGKYQVWKDSRIVDSDHLAGTLFPRNYPPFAIIVYLFLLQVCAPFAAPVMLGLFITGMVVACVLLWQRVRQFEAYRWYMGAAIFLTGLFGWGTDLVVMRGNIEGLMWIGVCVGAALYARRRYGGAAIAFGISCCLKPYPILWLGLMARQRKYREALWGLVSAAVVTLASLLLINPNPVLAYQHITAQGNFFEDYIVGFRAMDEAKFDHSLLQTMKTISRVVRYRGFSFPDWEYHVHPSVPLAGTLYHVTLLVTPVLGLVVLWRVWNKPVLNQMFAVACVMTVFPLIAADYTLTVIMVPMGFFLVFLLEDVARGRATLSRGEMLWFLMPCMWIMATEPQWILHGVLKCIAVLTLLGASMTIPLPSTVFGDREPRLRELTTAE